MAAKMTLLISILAVVAAIAATATIAHGEDFSIVGYSPDDLLDESRLESRFNEWAAKHGKFYSNNLEGQSERGYRMRVFRDNLEYIDSHNRKESSFSLGLTKFADLTNDEFRERHLGVRIDWESRLRQRLEKPSKFRYADVEVPLSVDWREKSVVTPIKDQGSCGSCWAFSAIGSVEGINALKTGKLISLSEQELVDCDTSYNMGCSGGLMDYSFEFIIANGGIDSDKDYPYTGRDGRCDKEKMNNHVVTIDAYEDVPYNNEAALLKAVASQPVSVAIEAGGRDFQLYSSGVFNGQCSFYLDHGVTAVGYGTDNGQDYWLIKNSWGGWWGESGYIRMARSTGKRYGTCGILIEPSYAVKY
ncbi:unnamed protein product [Calypogeia fissa]